MSSVRARMLLSMGQVKHDVAEYTSALAALDDKESSDGSSKSESDPSPNKRLRLSVATVSKRACQNVPQKKLPNIPCLQKHQESANLRNNLNNIAPKSLKPQLSAVNSLLPSSSSAAASFCHGKDLNQNEVLDKQSEMHPQEKIPIQSNSQIIRKEKVKVNSTQQKAHFVSPVQKSTRVTSNIVQSKHGKNILAEKRPSTLNKIARLSKNDDSPKTTNQITNKTTKSNPTACINAKDTKPQSKAVSLQSKIKMPENKDSDKLLINNHPAILKKQENNTRARRRLFSSNTTTSPETERDKTNSSIETEPDTLDSSPECETNVSQTQCSGKLAKNDAIQVKASENFRECPVQNAGLALPQMPDSPGQEEMPQMLAEFNLSPTGELLPVCISDSFEDLQVADFINADSLPLLNESPEMQNNLHLEIIESEESQQVIPAAPRKNKRSPSSWKVNMAKEARQSGKAYTSKEGKSYPAKVIRRGCGPSCKLLCETRVTDADRSEVFKAFYQKQDSQTRKWDFIRSCVDSHTPKKLSTGQKGKRTCSRKYHFILKGHKVRVCREMFTNTLCISDTVVRTAFAKQGEGGVISPDKRGKVGVRKKVPVEVIQSVHDHIRSFPRMASHYCRAGSTYEYLEEEVDSVTNMFRLYKIWMKDNHPGKKLASQRQYQDEFRTLKIKIFKPRKDQCDTCFSYKNLPEEEKNNPIKKADYESHILSKDQAESLKSLDKEEAFKDPTIATCAFDLQKVMLLPHCQAGAVYYKRKVSVLNFTVYDMSRYQGYCFVWHEAIGKKGANEIASFVLNYIETMVPTGVKTFKFWSDNCGAQNKNRFLFAMYVLTAAKHNIKIEHRFLIKGHTTNEADSMHSLIERKTRKRDVFLPEEWCEIMRNAKATGTPYIVKRVKQEDILDFHEFVNTHSSWNRDEDGQKIPWSDVAEVTADGSFPWQLNVKSHLGDAPMKINIRSKVPGRPVQLKTYQPPPAYNGQLPLPTKKLEDLQALCDSNIIPASKQFFYRALIARDDITDDLYATD